jgi:ABC-2 type transport system permease protein
MMGLFEAAWVIARRDFIATVYSKSFILFLIVPLIIFGSVALVRVAADDNIRAGTQPLVALVADTDTVQALVTSRARLVAGLPDQIFPRFQAVGPAENVGVQAGRLLADERAGYSAVFTGTLDRPVLVGPHKVDESVGRRMQSILDEARSRAAMDRAGVRIAGVEIERVVTAQAAGNLQYIRRNIAQGGQTLMFMVTVLLATLLLSNLAEEKSNKVIEVLAAAVPLDAVFLGKLIAMLGISLVGLSLWGGMLGLAWLFFQALQDFMTLPEVGPAVGWPAFLLLTLIYYGANYMLLGALFLGIGGQASNIREIQTLSMPVTMLQVFVFILAMNAIGQESGIAMWVAYILPFSSPLAMVAHAAQYETLWPHLVALVWQLLWIVLTIRISSRLFRLTVLKSSPGGAFFNFRTLFRRRAG